MIGIVMLLASGGEVKSQGWMTPLNIKRCHVGLTYALLGEPIDFIGVLWWVLTLRVLEVGPGKFYRLISWLTAKRRL